jgi:hypothetical protein
LHRRNFGKAPPISPKDGYSYRKCFEFLSATCQGLADLENREFGSFSYGL